MSNLKIDNLISAIQKDDVSLFKLTFNEIHNPTSRYFILECCKYKSINILEYIINNRTITLEPHVFHNIINFFIMNNRVSLLMNVFEHPDIPKDYNFLPFILKAAQYGKIKALKILIKKPYKHRAGEKYSALYIAIKNNHFNCFKLLINTDITSITANNNAAIKIAYINKKNDKMLSILADKVSIAQFLNGLNEDDLYYKQHLELLSYLKKRKISNIVTDF